jgi:hypothetical protein
MMTGLRCRLELLRSVLASIVIAGSLGSFPKRCNAREASSGAVKAIPVSRKIASAAW